MCLSLKVSTNAMCNSVWKCVLFMDMKSKAHGICINWIYVSHLRFFKIFIFIFQTRLLSNLNLSIITYSFSGSIHVQRTGSSCCPIFFRVSWLYDPLSYPSCGLKAFVSLTIWYFDKLATKKKKNLITLWFFPPFLTYWLPSPWLTQRCSLTFFRHWKLQRMPQPSLKGSH